MTITSSQYILVMWSLALYVVESISSSSSSNKSSTESSASPTSIPPFVSRILSIAVSHISGSEEMTPWPIFRQLVKGLERLLLLPESTSSTSGINAITPEVRRTLMNVALEKSNLPPTTTLPLPSSSSAPISSAAYIPPPSPRRVLAALALFISSTYTNTSLTVFPNSANNPVDDEAVDDAIDDPFGEEDSSKQYFVDEGDSVDESTSLSNAAATASNDAAAATPLNPSMMHMQSSDPEALIAAMEKATVLFDHLRKSSAFEANAVARLLPNFLLDFSQPQDVMNKLIGEFLSNQQPHPQLLAR